MQIEDGAVAPGRRERKKRETRDALMAAALRLAVEKGPDNVTVEEISEAADVSVRTFFNYFSHKEHAILGRDPDDLALALRRVREAPDGESPLTTMRLIVAHVIDELEHHETPISQRIGLIMQSPTLLTQFVVLGAEDERELAAALAERMGEPTGSPRPALIVGATTMAVKVAMEQRKAGSDRPLGALVDEAFSLIADGLDPAYHQPDTHPSPR
ncbi:TetR family transcriptional regulator [Kribbella catacumbae]|uniref:acyl-CoA-like ligand-binding transcription factor n=1 Tax=Kribbella catacumbae TaxID=460086 RepID=UPI00036119DC|nr:TetR family transcriptional regulator [Kribbella catacumbae]